MSLSLLLCVLIFARGVARAQVVQTETTTHRTVAVLEYRAGVEALAGIVDRLTHLLIEQTSFFVIDPAEARRRIGVHLDADVARCGGEPKCLAAIGEKLHADEILLVGLSQLGDVVVTIARIDCKKVEVASRLAEAVTQGAEPSRPELLGWLRRLYPPDVFLRYGALRIVANVEGASIVLNGAVKGRTPIDLPMRVSAPETYVLRLSKNGYAPFSARIDVLPDSIVEVRSTLVRQNEPTPVYKRWYLWAGIGAAAAIIGGSLAAYYATRSDSRPTGQVTIP